RLPRAAHDRRPHPPSPGEARAGSARPALHLHGARRRVPLPRPMNPLKSVGGRLSLALLIVVAGALAIVYGLVVPSLESRLVNAKLSQLKRAGSVLDREVPSNRYGATWLNFLENAAASANARVVPFDIGSPPPAARAVRH